MLDPTVDKILTTKKVEQKSTQKDVDKSPKTNDDFVEQASRPEAEVRLVVRFIVEEHIVYRGKVERVHQLESEELSRVVSRVAWDGASEISSKSTPDSENSLAEEKANIELDERPLQQSFQNQQTSSSTTTSAPQTSDQQTKTTSTTEGNKNADQVQEMPISNTDSSDDLEVCIRSISPQTCELIDGSQDLVAQVNRHPTLEESKTNNHCDNSTKQLLSHICESDHQYLHNSPITQEPSKQNSIDCEDTILDLELNSPPNNQMIKQLTNDNLVESQSVSDALNECVKNVDLESRRENVENFTTALKTNNIHTVPDSGSIPKQPSTLDHNGSIDDVERHLNMVEINVEMKQEDSPTIIMNNRGSKINSGTLMHNSTANNDQFKHNCESNDPNLSNQARKAELAGSSSGKRRVTGDHSSTGKRIRRVTPKDHRNQNTRTSATKVTEGSTPAQQTSTNNKLTTVSLLANNNQPIRQNKVFAKWTDNHFYPGNIVKLARDRKILIGFFDGANKTVAETDIIPLCNIRGKQVRVTIAKNYCVNAIVHDLQPPVNDQPMFDVEYQQDGVVRKCVPLKDIFLTGEQGTPLINQPDKNPGASNFADVDLDNIIYEKRPRRLQEMGDFELTENTSSSNKRIRIF